jgi:hypothetical protein
VWRRETGPAALDVDLGQRRRAHPDVAGDDPPAVHAVPGHSGLDVVDLLHRAVGQHDAPGVGELPAALGVEGRAVQHDLDLGPLPCLLGDGAVDEQAGEPRL